SPDGFEVCRRLKADPTTGPIPILLVTALSNREDRLEGIRAGANDFITKPINVTDTSLRVRNALRLKRVYDLSRRQYAELQELEKMRDSMVHMLVHDLKSPLTAIIGFQRLLEFDPKLEERHKGFVTKTLTNSYRLLEMISAVLDLNKIEQADFELTVEETTTEAVVAAALESSRPLTGSQSQLIVSGADQQPWSCDPEMIRRVLVNLLDNAAKYAPKEGGRVELELVRTPEAIHFAIRDNGPGISLDDQQKLFQKFVQAGKRHRYSTGLGLAFCRMAVEAHGGQLGVRSEPPNGTEFWFRLPLEGFPKGKTSPTKN
ncbi:MAG: response regulator, partial [Candidatus Eremiobacteraeota bacterium]|nr:response regulator [Candidatus Eremiobacteraeota bacterium]